MTRDTVQKIALGILIPVLLAFFWFVFSKGRMVWLHVDSDVPVSTQEERTKQAITIGEENKKVSAEALASIAKAIDELERQKIELLAAPVRGEIGREIGKSPKGKAIIFLNTNSDARRFKSEKQIEISFQGKAIPIEIGGTIINERELVIGQLNAEAAESLGISERRGIAAVTLRRLSTGRP